MKTTRHWYGYIGSIIESAAQHNRTCRTEATGRRARGKEQINFFADCDG
jgi:hypothetical protein